MSKEGIKILITSTETIGTNGVTSVILNYYRFMDKSDLQIDFAVLCDINPCLKQELGLSNSHVYKVCDGEDRIRKPLIYLIKLVSIIKKYKYNIFHAHGNSCTLAIEMFAAKIAGVKVRIAHSHTTKCRYKFAHIILRPFFDMFCTHRFACSYAAGKWLFKNKSFIVLPNGIDLHRFSYNDQIRKDIRQKYKLSNKLVIGHVGCFTYGKNHEFIIDIYYEMLNTIKDSTLMLVGDGDLKKDIEKKVRDLDIEDHVIFTGKSNKVEKLLQACDVMVLPSWYEGLPIVVVEWQAIGLPSIVSDNVTEEVKLTDLVKFLPLRCGVKEWANKINQINIIDRELMKEKVAKEIKAAGYDIEDNVKQLKIMYERMVR